MIPAFARRLRPALLAAALVALCVPAGAQGARGLTTGLMDSLFNTSNDSLRGAAFHDAQNAGAGIVRINVSWRAVATSKPDNASNPSDDAYHFDTIDAAVQDADARNLKVLLTITSAPNFAEGRNRPNHVKPGTWKPKPWALGHFAKAVATRYSGSFDSDPTLPRVRFYQNWNEANLSDYLTPQYVGRKAFASRHYRKMLNAFYKGVHQAQGNARVVTTGTAPYGDPRGGNRTRPLAFWRQVLCLKGRKALKPVNCRPRPKLDVLAHHPINTSGGPKRSALHPDDASTPDFKHVRRILRAAERKNRVRPRGHRQLWATELWWESKPADPCGVSQRTQAKYVRQSMRLLRKQGARVVIWLSVRDQPNPGNECGRGNLQAGLLDQNGNRKPAFNAFKRFGG